MTRPEPRTLSSQSSLETLRREAKRWLKGLRAGDADARARFAAACPDAPAESDARAPALRDVQHALAREYGLSGWAALKAALAEQEAARATRAQAADIVLVHAWDNGWRLNAAPAMRMLRVHPDLSLDSMHLAAICGDLAEVRRRLEADPASAAAKGGPLDFEPLQYLAYGRLDLPAVLANSVEIARLLLDNGADPNASLDDGWGNAFKVLTGVIGLGEGVRPPHVRDCALAELLIERGADPYDIQAMYNTSIVDDDIYWMDTLFRHSEQRGEAARWRAPGKASLGGPERSTIDYLLGNAVSGGHRRRARWLLDRGADPNGLNAYTKRPHHHEAQLTGDAEMIRILEEAGARPVALGGISAFQAAVLRLDRDEAARLAAGDGSLLSHAAAFAASRGNLPALRLLLDLGADVDGVGENATALHWAAHGNNVEMVKLLVQRGATIDVRDRTYRATAFGWANHMRRPEAAALLAPLTRDVHSLAAGGFADRLRAVLAEEPALANALAGRQDELTPLCCLPDDEDAAMEVASILLAAGADPRKGRRDGLTAEQAARKRGLTDAADLIAEGG